MAMTFGANCYGIAAALLCAIAASGCAGIQRFAPPGIVRYENLSGDQPQNPEIKARAAERKAGRKAKFPNLSVAPRSGPEAMPAAEQAALKDELGGVRDDMAAAILADRAQAAADRADPIILPGGTPSPLEQASAALAAAVEKDDAAARVERGLPPRVKPPKN